MSHPTTAIPRNPRPDYNSADEYYASRDITFPPPEKVNPDAASLSRDELLPMIGESEIEAFQEKRRREELVDAHFGEERPTDGMIVFTRHASESIRTTTDRELTKKVLQTMGPLAYAPGMTPELLDTIHTMMTDVYFWGRERLLAQAYDMGAAVKV